MDWLGLGHFATALLAMGTGAVVVLNAKGTLFHRWMGRLYASSMLLLNLTALAIYDLFGGFGPFHVAAIGSLVTIVIGVAAAWRRRPGWRVRHAYWMSWSYAGLLAAAVSESTTRYFQFDFGWSVTLSTVVVLTAGGLLINRLVPSALRPGNRR
ncbi:MAG: DUF2306 domain-containing protein [Xanthomonadales bacterium]|nr:DUF2306 domain-containing protein [Xanthomonadales bacterium]